MNVFPILEEKIKKNKENSNKKTFKFTICGHSLGGLIIRECVYNLFSIEGQQSIKRVINDKKLPNFYRVADRKRIDFDILTPEDLGFFFCVFIWKFWSLLIVLLLILLFYY